MSRTTRRKHVQLERLRDDFSPPNPNEAIVKILHGRGNNLHEVQAASGETFLVSMPTKFRRNVWVKRGDYILVQPIHEGDKVKAEMVRLLTSEHIKCFKEHGDWPDAFCDGGSSVAEDSQAADDDGDLFVNPNKRPLDASDSEEDSDN